MAFVTPKTWSFGEVLTSTDMNTYVRDNTADLDARIPEGIGPNVVQTIKTDTFTTTSASFTTVTGLTATITPSSATSKILVVVQVSHGLNVIDQGYGHFRLSGGNASTYVGNTDGNRTRAVFGGVASSGGGAETHSASIVFLDSPADTSAVTYGVEVRQAVSGAVFINRSAGDGNAASANRGASSITLIEVAA